MVFTDLLVRGSSLDCFSGECAITVFSVAEDQNVLHPQISSWIAILVLVYAVNVCEHLRIHEAERPLKKNHPLFNM